MARPAAHAGQLACAERHAALRVTGACRFGDREDYAGNMESQRDEYGTTTGLLPHSLDCKYLENKKFDMARDGIEPPTRGFTVRS